MSEALDMNHQDPYAIPLEDFDVSQAELFENPPVIENGTMRLNDAPGLGLELRYDTIEKYGRRIL